MANRDVFIELVPCAKVRKEGWNPPFLCRMLVGARIAFAESPVWTRLTCKIT